MAPVLREELAVVTQAPLTAQVQLGGLDVFASVAADPPHQLTGLLAVPTGRQVTDPRMSAPALARLTGTVPAGVAQIADEAAAELGLPGLTLAGGGPGTPPWLVTKGWADLDRVSCSARRTAGRPTAAPRSSRPRPCCAWSPRAGSPSTTRSTTRSAPCASRTPRSRSASCSPTPAEWTAPPRPSYSPTPYPTWSA